MKNKSAEQIQTLIIAVILPIVIIVYWAVASRQGLINTNVLASPESLGEKFLDMIKNGTLWKNVLASLSRVIKGFAIGASLGFVIGALCGLYVTVNKAFLALISLLRPIPPIALIPFFILWLGIGETSKIAIIIIGSFWPMLLNTIQGIQGTDPKLLDVASVFGKGKLVILFKIVLPSALPAVFTGIRLGIGQAWTCVVTAEMIAASAGVGYMIQYARELVQPDLLLLGIVAIGVVGLIIDIIVMLLQKKIIYWRQAS